MSEMAPLARLGKAFWPYFGDRGDKEWIWSSHDMLFSGRKYDL